MFKVLDKESRKLFIRDKIHHTYNEGPETITVEGIIISFPDEGEVQYQPIKRVNDSRELKDALPVICKSDAVSQVDSLAQRALKLKTDEEFQKLIKDAEQMYLDEVERTKKKKAGTRGGRTKAKPDVSLAVDADL